MSGIEFIYVGSERDFDDNLVFPWTFSWDIADDVCHFHGSCDLFLDYNGPHDSIIVRLYCFPISTKRCVSSLLPWFYSCKLCLVLRKN